MSNCTPTFEHGCSRGVLEQCLESFTTELTSLGYSAAVVRQKRAIVASFVRWTLGQRLAVATIDDATMEAFLAGVGYPAPNSDRRCTLAGFLGHLRAEGVTVRPEPERDHSCAALLQGRYEAYLLSERGLAQGTVASYRPYVSQFVRHHLGSTEGLRPPAAWTPWSPTSRGCSRTGVWPGLFRLNDGSGASGKADAPFCEGLRVKLPGATHPLRGGPDDGDYL